MKKAIFLLFAGLFISLAPSFGQEDKSKRPSPPAQAKATIGGKTITIDYSKPAVRDRIVWGEMVPYGKIWRTGANETTTFEVSDTVLIEGQPLPKGRYGLYTVPGEKEWVIVFNKTIAWGEYSYSPADDVLRVTVPSKASAAFQERFIIEISEKGVVSLLWENLQVDFTVQ